MARAGRALGMVDSFGCSRRGHPRLGTDVSTMLDGPLAPEYKAQHYIPKRVAQSFASKKLCVLSVAGCRRPSGPAISALATLFERKDTVCASIRRNAMGEDRFRRWRWVLGVEGKSAIPGQPPLGAPEGSPWRKPWENKEATSQVSPSGATEIAD